MNRFILSRLREKENKKQQIMEEKQESASPLTSRTTFNDNHGLVVSGSGNVLHVHFGKDGMELEKIEKVEEAEAKELKELPEALNTDKAKAIFTKFQKEGKLDEDFQPINLSRAYKALLANAIADELKVKNKWSVFERFWDIKALSSAYTRAMKQDNVVHHIKEIERIINL